MLKVDLIDWWFDNGNRNISVTNFKPIRKENLKNYPDDPDVNIKRKWGVHTNGARKGNPNHSCLDWQLDLGHIHINYTNFGYNRKYRL